MPTEAPVLPISVDTSSDELKKTANESSTPRNINKTMPKSKKHLFFYSYFRLSEEERLYQEFMSNENSWYVHGIIAAAVTIATLVNILQTYFGKDYPFGYQIIVYQRLSIIAAMWIHFYSITQKKYPMRFKPLPIRMIYLGDFYQLSFAISYGVFLYGLATADGCSLPSPPPPLMCEDHVSVSAVVLYVAFSMMFSVIIKCKHTVVAVLGIVIEMFFLSVVVHLKEPSLPNVLFIVVVFAVQCLVVSDTNIYSRRIYRLLLESRSSMQAKIMADNDNVIMEMQSMELRFLIGNVAHDLKTPLQAFSYELELMKRRPSTPEDIESISLLDSICSFMLMTINRAIDYTKVTSGIQLKPSMETVNVLKVCDWVKMCVARTVVAGSVSIVLDTFPVDMCEYIITDRQWLMENLLCLVSNAQKFTAQGSIRVKFSSFSNTDAAVPNAGGDSARSRSVSVESQPPSMVMVEVIDDGIGIPEEKQETLFKPFKQAMRRAGGTGLGIYSLSKRVESLGGACGVSSREDGKNGARFWFTLPYRPDVTAAAAETLLGTHSTSLSHVTDGLCEPPEIQNISHDPVVSSRKSLQDGAILLVEDSPLIQKTCARSLLREGITVDIANNGLECVEKIIEAPGRYTVLLMDVNMPVMDGLEATQRIREWERDRGDLSFHIEPDSTLHESKLLIIGVSANSDSQSKQEALDAGMDRFISKPLKISALRECLSEFHLDLDMFATKQ